MTESYLGLDQSVRGCQNEESLHECTTKHYKQTALNQCGCVPLTIALSKNVSSSYIALKTQVDINDETFSG